jgi:hypothetical protein
MRAFLQRSDFGLKATGAGTTFIVNGSGNREMPATESGLKAGAGFTALVAYKSPVQLDRPQMRT